MLIDGFLIRTRSHSFGTLFVFNILFNLGYIKSISYAVDNSSTYETEVGKRVPRHVIATIGYQVIHEKAPRLGTTFYGINETDADNTTTDGGTPGGFQDSSAGNLEFF